MLKVMVKYALLSHIIALMMSVAHANQAQQLATQQARQAELYWLHTCGGLTPDSCNDVGAQSGKSSSAYNAPIAHYDYVLLAAMWVKAAHPQSTNMPVFYTTALNTRDYADMYGQDVLAQLSIGLRRYAMTHCEQTYGKGMCIDAIGDAWIAGQTSNRVYVSVASADKQGTNSVSGLGIATRQSAAKNEAIANCKAEIPSWNNNAPSQLKRYQTRQCKVIYNQKAERVHAVHISDDTALSWIPTAERKAHKIVR